MANHDINFPYNFTPREYQRDFLHAMDSEGKKRAVCVWHRRAGKDKTFLNYLVPRMIERVGSYYYYFPTASMGRDILWDGMDRDSYKFLDHFPQGLIKSTNSTEMKIELVNGSVFKIRGTDKREPIGVNPIGCVFSEFSRQSPSAGWDLVRPILAENGGWAVFNFTPRGKNHAYRLYRQALNNPNWFVQRLTVDDTHAIPYEAIEEDRLSGMSEELIQQEYYCSFDVGAEGSYYGRSMSKLWDNGQIGVIPYESEAPVYTFWDLGIDDCTAIWFVQLVGHEVRLIDYYENYGEGLKHYADYLRSKPYVYAEHYMPHDVAKRQFQSDGSIETVMKIAQRLLEKRDPLSGHIMSPVKMVTPHTIDAGIENARILLQSDRKLWFDEKNCQRGIDCLENYHKEYKDKLETYEQKPHHDWSSHGADAFRYFAVAFRNQIVVNNLRVGVPDVLAPSAEVVHAGRSGAYGNWHVTAGRRRRR